MEENIYDYTVVHFPWAWRDFFEKKMKMIKCISDVIEKDVANGQIVLPKIDFLWNAFIHTSPQNLKVVILGQDPYPNIEDACGMAFSVSRDRNCELPKSLINIFDVLSKTVPNFEIPSHGDLSDWAVQGVLLVNTALTVISGCRNSHARPWSQFSNALIEYLSDNFDHIVFMLWGKQAQSFRKYIDKRKHLVLETSHPSPLSFTYGFNECNHFNQANEYLKLHGKKEIDWRLDGKEEVKE